MTTQDYRKKAEEIFKDWEHYDFSENFMIHVSNVIRTASEKAYREGWNKAINEAAHYACDAVHHVSCKPLSMEKKGHYIAKHIRRLISEEK